MSADYAYPEDGACYGHKSPELWDVAVEGETVPQRHARHNEAARICSTCPVQVECLRARDPQRDEGVRAGVLFLLGGKFGGYGAVEGIVRAPWRNKRAAS